MGRPISGHADEVLVSHHRPAGPPAGGTPSRAVIGLSGRAERAAVAARRLRAAQFRRGAPTLGQPRPVTLEIATPRHG